MKIATSKGQPIKTMPLKPGGNYNTGSTNRNFGVAQKPPARPNPKTKAPRTGGRHMKKGGKTK